MSNYRKNIFGIWAVMGMRGQSAREGTKYLYGQAAGVGGSCD